MSTYAHEGEIAEAAGYKEKWKLRKVPASAPPRVFADVGVPTSSSLLPIALQVHSVVMRTSVVGFFRSSARPLLGRPDALDYYCGGIWKHQQEHINVKECRVVLMAIRRACLPHRTVGKKILAFTDTLVLALALEKGRSRAKGLNSSARRVCAYCLAHGLRVRYRYLESERNPAHEGGGRLGYPWGIRILSLIFCRCRVWCLRLGSPPRLLSLTLLLVPIWSIGSAEFGFASMTSFPEGAPPVVVTIVAMLCRSGRCPRPASGLRREFPSGFVWPRTSRKLQMILITLLLGSCRGSKMGPVALRSLR